MRREFGSGISANVDAMARIGYLYLRGGKWKRRQIIPKAFVESGESGGWLKYDQVVHAYGFGVATWLCWQGLCGALTRNGAMGATDSLPPQPTPGLMLIVATAGMGLGAVNEIVEFIATRITVTNVGGYVNTGWDLVFNAIGAIGTAFIIYYMRSPRRPE